MSRAPTANAGRESSLHPPRRRHTLTRPPPLSRGSRGAGGGRTGGILLGRRVAAISLLPRSLRLTERRPPCCCCCRKPSKFFSRPANTIITIITIIYHSPVYVLCVGEEGAYRSGMWRLAILGRLTPLPFGDI